MGKVYKNDTAIKITVVCDTDITNCLEKKIKYRKPNGIMGYWLAEIAVSLIGEIYYDVQSSEDLDESGGWAFWSYIKFADGHSSNGEVFKKQIYEPGQ